MKMLDKFGTMAVSESEAIYEGEMQYFFVVPGVSETIRIKGKMPFDADGFMIYRSTAAYAGQGIGNWGSLVADITDDSSMDGDNEWYSDTGRINCTRYFYKAFPYKGNSYNETIGQNESSAKGGGLVHEYTMDNVSGSTVYDTASSQNITAIGTYSFQSGVVGNGIYFNNESYLDSNVELLSNDVWSLDLHINADSFRDATYYSDAIITQSSHLGDGKEVGWGIHIWSSKIEVYRANSDYPNYWQRISFANSFNTGTDYHLHMQRNGNLYYLWVNNNSIPSYGSISTPATGYSTHIGAAPHGGNGINGSIDQVRMYIGRQLEVYEIFNLCNNGIGC